MIKKFKSLSKRNQWIVGIISFLLLPITLILLSANIAINGLKQGKIGKSIGGVLALLLVIGIIWQDDSGITTETYKEKELELNKANIELSKVKEELNQSNENIRKQEETIESAKPYLDLNEKDKTKVMTFIDNLKNEENNTSYETDKPEIVGSVNTEKAENNESKNIEQIEEQQEPESNSESTVYANGGRSKSNKYHSSPTVHNMEGAIGMSESEARSKGYVPCKKCY